MASTMSKGGLIDAVASKTGMTKSDAKTAVDALIGEVTDQLKAGNKIQITGFGTFEVRHRNARQGVNPSTGKKITIKASNAPAFKAGSALKEAVN